MTNIFGSLLDCDDSEYFASKDAGKPRQMPLNDAVWEVLKQYPDAFAKIQELRQREQRQWVDSISSELSEELDINSNIVKAVANRSRYRHTTKAKAKQLASLIRDVQKLDDDNFVVDPQLPSDFASKVW